MSILARLANALKTFTATQTVTAGQNIELLGLKGAVPSFNMEAAKRSFRGWPYVAAMKNAVALASTPMRLYAAITDRNPDEPKIARYKRLSPHDRQRIISKAPSSMRDIRTAVEITEHPVLDLLREVNPFREEAEHLIETLLWLQATGNAYWLVESGGGVMAGIPTKLWILPSDRVTPIPDKEQFIRGYYYGGGANRVELPVDRVIHFREPSIASMWLGYGRMESAWAAIEGHEALDAYESQTARTPMPTMAVISKQPLTPRQRRELGMEYRRSLSSATGGGANPVVADSEISITPLSHSPKEIAAPLGRKLRREEIINAFDQTMGLYSESATRANADAAIYLWSRFGLDPLATRIAQKLNTDLLYRYDGGDRLFFAFDALATEDRTFLLQQEQSDLTNGVRTVNEVRRDRGLEPLSEDEIRAFAEMRRPQVIVPSGPAANADDDKAIKQKAGSMHDKRYIDGASIHPSLRGVPVGLLG